MPAVAAAVGGTDDDGEPGGSRPALTIAELYDQLDRALRAAVPGEVWVSGEVRSFKVSSRGHCYIDLVDPASGTDTGGAVLKVVCWSGRWARVRAELDRLGIALEAGLVVRVRGGVELYKPRGDISFILSELDTEALLGRVAAERARLLKALVDEDLFDANRRLAVPGVVLRVGLVASPGTEGYHDFLGRLEESGMAFAVSLVPTQVQGREAPAAVAGAVRALSASAGDLDVIVIVRGGGSKSDLATFDTEPVARAVATAALPVWTGIGHTGDRSLADEVAHRSFITPTECGQELARRATEVWSGALSAGLRVAGDVAAAVDAAGEQLDRSRRRLASGTRLQLDRHVDAVIHRAQRATTLARVRLDVRHAELATRARAVPLAATGVLHRDEAGLARRATALAALPTRALAVEDRQLSSWRRLLAAYDYQRQLDRGYSVTRDAGGRAVRSVADLAPGDRLVTQVADGRIGSVVSTDSDDPPTNPHRGGPTP